jgi:hypothetical protein
MDETASKERRLDFMTLLAPAPLDELWEAE